MDTDFNIQLVQRRIEDEGLDLNTASKQIGVSRGSLELHLNGNYIRSDSIAKYRLWLQQRTETTQISLPFVEDLKDSVPGNDHDVNLAELKPDSIRTPFPIVDLFCGCGGMSLGFDLLEDGRYFRTVLAVDNEAPMVRAYNDNIPKGREVETARQIDLTDFVAEEEVLCYYLAHFSRHQGDDELKRSLTELPLGPLDNFLATLQALDAEFQEQLSAISDSPEFKSDYKELQSNTLGQTSVRGFHTALRLPINCCRNFRI